MAAGEGLERVYRDWYGRAVAALARGTGDLDLAEDCVQDAWATALARWPLDGMPDEPGAWIVRVARNRAIDVLRRRRTGTEREELARRLDLGPPPELDSTIPDDRLELLFACSHPDVAPESRLPLVLRLVAGLTVPEIARALLADERAVAQRIVRAKRRIRERGIALATPPDEDLPDRLDAVLAVILAMYTEGHVATAGDAAIRTELCDEAIRLARALVALMPDEAEARGLLALLLATDARRDARLDAAGRYVPLDRHDRGRYRRDLLKEADRLLRSALPAGGRLAIQGAIAAVHTAAPTWEATDWPQVVALYDALDARAPSPVVRLNRAVAIGFRDGPAAALPLLEELAGVLDAYAPLHAARADALRRLGRPAEAAAAYHAALARTGNAAEREHLAAMLAAVEAGDGAGTR